MKRIQIIKTGVFFLITFILSCSPVRSHVDSKLKAYTDKLAEKIVSEMHRSFYGTYGGLNLKKNNQTLSPGFNLNNGKLIEGLDSIGNQEWALRIDTNIKYLNPGSVLNSTSSITKLQYSLDFTTQGSSLKNQEWSRAELNQGYKIIQASSILSRKPNAMIINGGLQIQTPFQEDKYSGRPSTLKLQFLFSSLSVDDLNGNILGGKTRFQAIDQNYDQVSVFKGTIQFFSNQSGKIQIGDQFYQANFQSGKVISI